ncbi:MobP3 family relaxase [Enterocloster sp.]|uniref:MobP3 family relaxase n=1 Tax=Enterocloster sp. TaxID=2719315 RepID=UPI0039A28333
MPKIIFTSRYLRDAPPEQLGNYVKYIGTREGVEKIDESKGHLPATAAQKNLIAQLLRDLPKARAMLEYEDYRLHPTRRNASEFISTALEWNLDLLSKRENYVDYLANRPHVERIGEHGLFTDAGKPVVIARVQEEVKAHKGPVWTHVVSLKREDAARLGYDSGKQWMELLRSKRAMFCKQMKIDSENLRWYAAFHNESYHPHVHVMVYSAKDHDGFLTEPAIEAMRSELAHDIFRQDFANLYGVQNAAREGLKKEAEQTVKRLIQEIQSGTCQNQKIEKQIHRLSKRLQRTNGKKVYGYLKADLKQMVDRIVDELEQEPHIKELYQSWGTAREKIWQTYSDQPIPLAPLSQQKELKRIKNMVITEAMKIGSHHFLLEESSAEETDIWIDRAVTEMGSIAGDERRGESERRDAADEPEDNELPGDNDIDFHAEWSDTYKVACQCLYGSDEKKPDFKEAFRLFSGEAEEGNALAMFDLGRMYADGLGREADPAKAHEWYGKALTAFVAAEQCAEERQRPYLQYRIGKMYAAGLGYELPVVPDEEGGDGKAVRDYEKAVAWLEKAAEAEHASAQYALANIYLAGEAVAKDVTKATELFTRAAKQGHDYAAYQLGKQFLQGEETEKDVEAAIKWLKQSAAANNQYAQYSLGKLYLDGEKVEKDIRTAITYLKKSAAQNNAFAEYRLGRFYLLGEDVEADVKEAVQWLEQSASQGNQYAQYALGKLYLCGHEVPRNKEKALPYLEASAAQGNIYAQFLLDHLDSFYEPSVFLATTRLMHRLAQMFEEEKWKAGGSSMQVEGKLRSRIREKKKAMGHKSDDETPCQNLS